MQEQIVLTSEGTKMIRPYQTGDEDPINTLFTNVFQKQRSLEHWDWKYKNNLLRKTIVTVAEEDKEIAGHVALVPYQAKWFDTEILFGARTDTMVSPKHRGKGLYRLLNEEMIASAQQNNIDYLFGYPAPKAKILFEKYTGADEVGFIPRLMKINRVSSLIINRLPFLKAFHSLLKGVDIFFRSKAYQLPEGYSLKKIEKANHSFNSLWERGKSEYNILLKRDADFINWRFLEHPDFTYQVLGLFKADHLVGYVVTRVEEKTYGSGAIKNGYIVDLFAEPAEEIWEILLKSAITQLQEADLIQTWALEHTPSYKILTRKLKFKHKDAPMPLVGKKLNERLSEQVTLSDWYITPGDVDSF